VIRLQVPLQPLVIRLQVQTLTKALAPLAENATLVGVG
jgi:hypothetical protein